MKDETPIFQGPDGQSAGAASTDRLARSEILVLCLGYGLGNAGSTSQPVWVAAAIAAQDLSAPAIGWLASGELVAIAAAALSGPLWVRRLPSRTAIILAALGILAGNLLAMGVSTAALVTGRMLSGLAMGMLLAAATSRATRNPGAQRTLTFMQGAVLLIGMSIFAASPLLMPHGPAGIFAVLAGLGAITVLAGILLLKRGPDAVAATAPDTGRRGGTFTLSPVLACIGIGLATAGGATIGTYFLIIGAGLGFDPAATGQLLAAALPFSILGPVAGHLLGQRAGIIPPILAALVLIAACILVIVHAPTLPVFGMALAVQCALVMFFPPYALALVGRVDPSGRWATVGVGAMMIGSGMGPRIGSEFVGTHAFAGMGALAAGLVLAAAIPLSAAWLARRTQTVFMEKA